MKVKLDVMNRVILFNLINTNDIFTKANALTFRMVDAAKHVLGLDEKDRAFFEIREENGLMYFDNREKALMEYEYTLPDPLMADVMTLLRGMNERKELKANEYKLWQKLMPEDERMKESGAFNPDEFKRTEVKA